MSKIDLSKEYEGDFFTFEEPTEDEVKTYANAFGSGYVKIPETTVVSVLNIVLSPHQARKHFDEESLERLAESIRTHGVIEPILVRRIDENKYELIAGERRLKATRMAGLSMIPVSIQNVDDNQASEISLIENLQRENLNPLEQAEGILALMQLKFGLTREELLEKLKRISSQFKSSQNVLRSGSDSGNIAEFQAFFNSLGLGKLRSFLETKLRLLFLPGDIQTAVAAGKIEYTKAMALAKVEDEDSRKKLLKEAVDAGLGLAAIKKAVAALQVDKRNEVSLTGKALVKDSLKSIERRISARKAWTDKQIMRAIRECEAKISRLLNESDNQVGT